MQPVPDMRYEIKVVARHEALSLLRMLIMNHSAGFTTVFPKRHVNNVYFDSLDMKCLEEHLSGCSRRSKIRFRWYGDTRAQVFGVMEIKHKHDRLGWKESVVIDHPVDLTTMSWIEIYRILYEKSTPAIKLMLADRSTPVFINTYLREYYASRSTGVRITLDSDHHAYDQRMETRASFKMPLLTPRRVILEFKSQQHEREALEEVLDKFPLRPTRNSKFVSCAYSTLY